MDKSITTEERLALLGIRDECEKICNFFGVTLTETFARDRSMPVILAKHSLWSELKRRGWSASAIARVWCVHHTTVLEAFKKSPDVKPGG